MRLEPNAVRAILLTIEDTVFVDEPQIYGKILNNVPDALEYTKEDLKEALYQLLTTNPPFLDIVGLPKYDNNGNLIILKIRGLTFAGSEFVNSIRDKKIFDAVLDRAKAMGMFTLQGIADIAAKSAVNMLSDPNSLNSFIATTKNFFKR